MPNALSHNNTAAASRIASLSSPTAYASVPVVRIRRVALASALQACKNVFPDAFIGLFREKDGVLTELFLAPLAEYGRSHSSFPDWHVPSDASLVATIHSHPNGVLLPSRQDLRFFSSSGRWHFIAGAPYGLNDVACYDSRGQPVALEVVR